MRMRASGSGHWVRNEARRAALLPAAVRRRGASRQVRGKYAASRAAVTIREPWAQDAMLT